jgi:hypothetical protein
MKNTTSARLLKKTQVLGALKLTTNGIFIEKRGMINVMVLRLGGWPTWAAEVALAHGNLATMNRLPCYRNCARQPLLPKFLQETALVVSFRATRK